MFEQFLTTVTNQLNSDNPEVNKYIKWVSSLARNAVFKWVAISQSGLECEIKLQGLSGEVIRCGSGAIAVCVACKQPCCLEHAMVSGDGSAICLACVENQKSILGKNGSKNQQDTVREEDPQKLRKRYRKVLGVDSGADLEQIQAAYKHLAKKYHPDRAKNDKERKEFTDKLSLINQSFNWLKKDLE